MKKFSVLSWNVEHFKLKTKDVDGILDHIHRFDPDVMGIYEVEGKDVYDHMVSSFPNYSFHITEGRQTQEILVGVRGSMTSFLTQRIEFKTGNDFLRPGALLSLHHKDTNYSILFLHTRSFPAPIGFGTRDSQFQHAFKLKKALDKKEQGNTNFIILGDLNTMGMKYPFEKSIISDIELQKLQKDAQKTSMRILQKDHDETWTDGKRKSNLDHVIASTNLKFKKFSEENDVQVTGWNELDGSEKKHFITKISDHNSLYFEVV